MCRSTLTCFGATVVKLASFFFYLTVPLYQFAHRFASKASLILFVPIAAGPGWMDD